LSVDPSNRTTVDAALSHPWLHVDDEALSCRSLDSNLASFRDFAAKKRFRKIVLSVMAIQKMQRMVKQNESDRTRSNSSFKFENVNVDETSGSEAVPTTAGIYVQPDHVMPSDSSMKGFSQPFYSFGTRG